MWSCGTWAVRRQLFLWVDDNYFSRSTTTTLYRPGAKPSAVWVLLHKIKDSSSELWECGNRGAISKGRWEEWKTWFWFSRLSTAPSFPQLRFSWLIRLRPGFPLADSSWRVPRGNWEYSVR